VHETGHEWFANNITNKDIADMWIHESFTSYSESLFLEYHFDKATAYKYVRGQRQNIKNQAPMIGQYNVHREGSGDMYDKGANMLHTIRQIVNDDDLWREILRGLSKTFYHKTVTTKQIEDYIIQKSGKSLTKVFDQYLRDIRVPNLEYFIKDKNLKFRWSNVVKGFDMSVRVKIAGKVQWLTPTTQWSEVEITENNPSFEIDPNFYISSMNILSFTTTTSAFK